MGGSGAHPPQIWVAFLANLHKIIIKVYHNKHNNQPIISIPYYLDRVQEAVHVVGAGQGGDEGMNYYIYNIENLHNKFEMEQDKFEDSIG